MPVANPFGSPKPGLAAHARQPAGKVHIHLYDDEMSPQERKAARLERDRIRKQEYSKARRAAARSGGLPPVLVVRNPTNGRFERVE